MNNKKAAAQIVYLPIEEIRDYDNNPRDNDGAVEAVAQSIERFGVRVPAIVDKDNVLIAGHTRIKAAKRLGLKEFPCVRADDLTSNQAKAFRLADNRIQEDSAWDVETLQEEFKALRETGFDLSNTGFSEFEINGLSIAPGLQFEADELDEDEYDTPEMESGYVDPEDYDETGDADRTEYFVFILCCRGEEEKQAAAQLIGETGTLKGRYTVSQVRAMLEGDPDDEDAGV